MSIEFEPEEKESIRDLVKRYYQRSETFKNPLVLTMVGMRIAEEYKKIPFQEMERALRELNSTTYLLAWPIKLTINIHEGDVISLIPTLDKKKEYPYFFYVAFSNQEFSQAISLLKSNYDINFANLANTGFPFPRPGTDLSKELHSRDN